jgi:hypothetical protein
MWEPAGEYTAFIFPDHSGAGKTLVLPKKWSSARPFISIVPSTSINTNLSDGSTIG